MACSACVTGTLHTGTPAGKEETLYGLPTYVASPASGTAPKGTIVIIPDAFGCSFNNNRILADSYATKGNYRVLLPDFMGGWDLSSDVLTYMDGILKKHESWGVHSLYKAVYVAQALRHALPWMYMTRFAVAYPRVVAYLTKLRDEGEKHIGVAGFCWGGKHVFILCADKEKTATGESLVDVAFAAHPSFIVLPTDADGVKKPLSIAAPSEDIQIKKDQIPVLEAALKNCPAECEVKVYEGATHGELHSFLFSEFDSTDIVF